MEKINRVSQEWKQWKEQELKIAELAPGDLGSNRRFQERKLDFLERLQVRYQGSGNKTEQLMLIALDDEKRKIERSLYPNRIIRFVRSMVKQFRDQNKEQKLEKQANQSIDKIKDKLILHGYEKAAAKVEHFITLGHYEIPMSEYRGQNDRIDMKFLISSNDAGDYTISGVKAALLPEGKNEMIRQHQFEDQGEKLINLDRAYHLLSGRPVLTTSLNGNTEGKWTQLDLNDKDALGSYRVREYPGFDIDKAVQQMALVQPDKWKDLADALKLGEPVEAAINHPEGTRNVLLKIAPALGEVTMNDHQGDRIVQTPKEVIEKLSTGIKPEQKQGKRPARS